MIPVAILWHYLNARRRRFTDRATLEAWQQRKLGQFRRRVLSKSPWFRRYLRQPLANWPQMDKALMMTHFDAMNTAELRQEMLLACAHRAEQSRDFRPCASSRSAGTVAPRTKSPRARLASTHT